MFIFHFMYNAHAFIKSADCFHITIVSCITTVGIRGSGHLDHKILKLTGNGDFFEKMTKK